MTQTNIPKPEVTLTAKAVPENSILYCILAIGFALRLWNINWGLPAVYEEAIAFNMTWHFWNIGQPGFDFHPQIETRSHFFIYPALTFYLHFAVQAVHFALGYLAGFYPSLEKFHNAYTTNPTAFIVISRLVSTLFDMGSIFTVWLVGRRYWDRRVGLLAAFLVAVNVLHIRLSQMIKVDAALTFFCVLSLYMLCRLQEEPKMKRYLLAGISIGLACASKYNGVLLIFALFAVHLSRSHSFWQGFLSLRDRRFLFSIASCLGVFLLFNPYVVLRFGEFLADMKELGRISEAGILGINTHSNTFLYYLLDVLPANLGWMFLIVTLLSLVYFGTHFSKRFLPLLVFPIVYVATASVSAARFDYYLFPTLPFLILGGSIGIVRAWDWTQQYAGQKGFGRLVGSKLLRLGSGAAILVLIAGSQVNDLLAYHRTFALPDTRVVVAEWIRKNVSPGSAIATGPFWLDFSKDPYAVLMIPFNAGATEQTIPFYDARWYEDLDLVITSNYDYERFLREPERFKEILPYFETLKTRWMLAYEIVPAANQNGFTFRLYCPPKAPTHGQFDSTMVQRLGSADKKLALNFAGRLGMIESTKGKLFKSEQLLLTVLNFDPKNETAYRELATMYHKSGEFGEALVAVESYLMLHGNDAEMYALKGSALVSLGRMEEAEKPLLDAIALDKSLENPYVDLSLVYASSRDTDRLRNILTRYLQILPSNSERARLVVNHLKRLQTKEN